jgi:hypothetical protein
MGASIYFGIFVHLRVKRIKSHWKLWASFESERSDHLRFDLLSQVVKEADGRPRNEQMCIHSLRTAWWSSFWQKWPNPVDATHSSWSGHTAMPLGRTAPVRDFVIPEVNRTHFESWILHQLAVLLHQLELSPSVVASGFAVRRGWSAEEVAFTKHLRRQYITLFLRHGWLVRQRLPDRSFPTALNGFHHPAR